MNKTIHFKGHRWSTDELTQLMQMWADDVALEDIAKKLNATNAAISKMVVRLRQQGIPLKRRTSLIAAGRRGKPWTQSEVEYLMRRRAEKATLESIGHDLGRTWSAINAMITKLRHEEVPVAMYGNGSRRLWDVNALKVVAGQMPDLATIQQVESIN